MLNYWYPLVGMGAIQCRSDSILGWVLAFKSGIWVGLPIICTFYVVTKSAMLETIRYFCDNHNNLFLVRWRDQSKSQKYSWMGQKHQNYNSPSPGGIIWELWKIISRHRLDSLRLLLHSDSSTRITVLGPNRWPCSQFLIMTLTGNRTTRRAERLAEEPAHGTGAIERHSAWRPDAEVCVWLYLPAHGLKVVVVPVVLNPRLT